MTIWDRVRETFGERGGEGGCSLYNVRMPYHMLSSCGPFEKCGDTSTTLTPRKTTNKAKQGWLAKGLNPKQQLR